MAYVIQCADLAGTLINQKEPGKPDGMFLHSFDVDAFNGFGDVQWTTEINHAMVFETHEAAHRAWRTQSTVRPTRDDGMPNRPLTAFTIVVHPVEMVET